MPWSIVLLFVGLEFFYYWYHRTSHTSRWFWAAHSVHHSPNQLNLAAAYRLGWFGKFTGTSLFFTPLVFLGFTPTVVLSALFLNLLYQFWLHADWIPRLGWLEYVFNTPSSHRVHHARNPEYLDANYGGVLIVFDRLFGTYIAERDDVRCDYGLISHPEVVAQHPGHQLRALDRPGEGPALGALAAPSLDVPVRPAGLASRRRGADDGRDPPARRPRSRRPRSSGHDLISLEPSPSRRQIGREGEQPWRKTRSAS